MAANQKRSVEGDSSDAAPAVVPLNVDDPVFSEFPFPSPYDIQQQLMTRIVQTIQRGQVGVFESPTGTGKSISIICSALAWLKRAPKDRDEERNDDDDVDDDDGKGNESPARPQQPLGGATGTASHGVKDNEGNSAPSWLTAALSAAAAAAAPGAGPPGQSSPVSSSAAAHISGGASGGVRRVIRANARVLSADRDNEVLLSRLAMKKKRQRMWKQQREAAKSSLRKRSRGSPSPENGGVDGDAEFLVSETPEDVAAGAAAAAAKALSREDEVLAQTRRLLEGDEWDLEAVRVSFVCAVECSAVCRLACLSG